MAMSRVACSFLSTHEWHHERDQVIRSSRCQWEWTSDISDTLLVDRSKLKGKNNEKFLNNSVDAMKGEKNSETAPEYSDQAD